LGALGSQPEPARASQSHPAGPNKRGTLRRERGGQEGVEKEVTFFLFFFQGRRRGEKEISIFL
jgi:hypothetical protein